MKNKGNLHPIISPLREHSCNAFNVHCDNMWWLKHQLCENVTKGSGEICYREHGWGPVLNIAVTVTWVQGKTLLPTMGCAVQKGVLVNRTIHTTAEYLWEFGWIVSSLSLSFFICEMGKIIVCTIIGTDVCLLRIKWLNSVCDLPAMVISTEHLMWWMPA